MNKLKKQLKLVAVITLSILVFAAPLFASDIAIIKSNNIVAYNQTIEGSLSETKGDVDTYDLHGHIRTVSNAVKKIKKNPPKLIFALGVLATVSAMSNFPKTPIVYTMVHAIENKNIQGKKIFGISIEVSAIEQLRKLQALIPEIKTIGVLYSQRTEKMVSYAQASCNELCLTLDAVKITKPEEVPDSAKKLLPRVDSLWLMPDSIVVNQASLHYLLLLTLENNVPFMVYNKNFVKGGALFSPTVNYTKVGQQAAKISKQVLHGKVLPAAITPPADVEWAINLYTAGSMELNIPAEVLSSFKYVYPE